MTATSHTLTVRANFGNAKTGMQNAVTGSIQPAIIAKCRSLFPLKTWAHIAVILGLSERTAKHRMAGTREFTADDFARLLYTEHGFEILIAAMADQQPSWWRVCRPLMKVAEVQRMQLQARRQLRKAVEDALDADKEITAAITRAEMLSDEEFVSTHIDGLRAAGRTSDRALVKAAIPKPKP